MKVPLEPAIAMLLAFGAGCASRPHPIAACCSAEKVLLDGVEAAQPNGVYRVQGDAVMPRRLADREAVMLRKNWNGMIARDEAMQFRAGERVRVIEVQRHVKRHDSVGPYYENWSRVQSLERPQEAPVWIFDTALHPAQ
jgi:hypothetical protein